MRWAGTVLSVFIFLAAAWSTIWAADLITADLCVSFQDAKLSFAWANEKFLADGTYHFEIRNRTSNSLALMVPQLAWFRLRQATLHLWVPFLICAAPTAWLWYSNRSPAPGKCRCGYDLTGNTSGRCPECGACT
jgi:hypothetical protein